MFAIRFSTNLDLLTLPLVSLTIDIPIFQSASFANLLAVINACKTLEDLDISDILSRSRFEELFDEEARPRRLLHAIRVHLPLLKSITFGPMSPLISKEYLSHFDLSRETGLRVCWTATSYQIAGAIGLDIPAFFERPVADGLGFRPTHDHRITWLSQICTSLIGRIYLGSSHAQYANFDASSFSYRRGQEIDKQTEITIHSLSWRFHYHP